MIVSASYQPNENRPLVCVIDVLIGLTRSGATDAVQPCEARKRFCAAKRVRRFVGRRPAELVKFRGRLALIKEDPDGDFLDGNFLSPPGFNSESS